jgi:hypothetical protein
MVAPKAITNQTTTQDRLWIVHKFSLQTAKRRIRPESNYKFSPDIDGSSPIDPASEGKTKGQKNYAVGLEIRCPDGVCLILGPLIPGEDALAGALPSKCELVYNRTHSSHALTPSGRRQARGRERQLRYSKPGMQQPLSSMPPLRQGGDRTAAREVPDQVHDELHVAIPCLVCGEG